jgi:hypothetical protein
MCRHKNTAVRAGANETFGINVFLSNRRGIYESFMKLRDYMPVFADLIGCGRAATAPTSLLRKAITSALGAESRTGGRTRIDSSIMPEFRKKSRFESQ